MWDFICVTASRLPTAALLPFLSAEEKKISKYKVLESNNIVQPVAVKTLEGLGPSTLAFIADLGRRISASSGNKCAAEFLRQRIGIVV